MRTYRVNIGPLAQQQLLANYAYIKSQTNADIAGKFISKIETYCLSLGTLPKRGKDRSDIRPNLRVVGYMKKASVAFLVNQNEVVILGVFFRGQNIEDWLTETSA